LPDEVIVAPSTQAIPPGLSSGVNVVATGALNTNDVLHFGFASAVADSGVTQPTFDLDLYQSYPGTRIVNRDTPWTATNVLVNYTATGPTAFALVLQGGGTPVGARHGTAFGYHAEVTRTSLVHCAYGTRRTGLGTVVQYITPELVALIFAAAEDAWLIPFMFGLYWQTLDTETLCGKGPPPLPNVDFTTLPAALTTTKQIFDAYAWPYFCECVPGTPPPTGFPRPVIPEPPGLPATPIFPCSDIDPCGALVAIQKQLAAISQTLGSNLELTTLLQRYGLPFAYISGATHQISASGSFQVSRLVGVKVVVTGAPGDLKTFTGVPEYISDLGWISLVTGDGLMDEVRLTRAEQFWFPKLMPLAMSLGIGLREGVTVSVQELEAEP